MQKVPRLVLVSLFATIAAAPSWAAEDPSLAPAMPSDPTPKPIASTYATAPARGPLPPAEYKRADLNFYPQAQLLVENPTVVIIPKNKITQKSDSYFFTPKIRAPKNIYMEVLNDWIEPITPPDMPPSLGVAPDAMQIREPQGDVEVALPSNPASFAPVTNGMTLPNGAVVRTGADGTAAVLFGGVDSARLMPNSAAAVEQTVTAKTRSAEVDLTSGGVFSKVGTQLDVKGVYDVHTPFGNASARGGDFVAITTSGQTDVWVAKGTVSLEAPVSKDVRSITSDGTGALKLISYQSTNAPSSAPAAGELSPDVETLTAILNFIPLANQKIKALRDKAAGGGTLTANEQAYLDKIRQVPSLIKLALIEPPAPPPAPHLAPAPKAAPLPPTPVAIDLQADNSVIVNGAPTNLDDLKSHLADIANPKQPIVINGREKVTHAQLLKVIAICHEAKLKVKLTKAAPLPKPVAPPAVAAEPTPTAAPVVPKTEAPTISPPPPAPEPAPAPLLATPTLAPVPPAAPVAVSPVEIILRPDGKVDLMGQTMGLEELKSRLTVVAKANPDQPLVIKGKEMAAPGLARKVRTIYKGLKMKMVVYEPSPKAPPKAPTAPTAPAKPSAPAPAIIETPVPTPPMPTPEPTAAAIPTTNSAPTVTAPPVTAGAPTNPAAPAEIKSITIRVRTDGKVNLQSATFELPGFKKKLEKILKATPDQSFVVRAGKKVPYDKVQAVLDICANAQVKHLDVEVPPPSATPAPGVTAPGVTAAATPATPTPAAIPAPPTTAEAPAAPTPSTENLPPPRLRMNPYMEPTPPSALPPPSPTLPTTNAPSPSPGP